MPSSDDDFVGDLCGWSAYPPRLSVNADIPARRPSAISGPSALQQTACLLGVLPNLHNPRHSDCKGRTTTGLALDRDVAAHHLAEPFTDHEAESGTAVLARGGG